jgi:hypothetical protein
LNFNATISSINSIGRLNGISYIDINKLVANNGGGTLIMMYQLNQNSRIIENNSGNTIALYPNPASDFVTIKIPKMILPVDIAIMDICYPCMDYLFTKLI